jgi:hypothetical protein
MKNIYLILAIAGSIIPWSFLLGFFLKEGLSVDLFFDYIFTNPVSSAVAADLLISASVFLCFTFSELTRLGLSLRWMILYVFATFAVGLSCSLPLFLYMREQTIAVNIPSKTTKEIS